MAPLMAGVFAGRGARALVFRGDDGLDELTLGHDVDGLVGARRRVTEHRLDPATLGLERHRVEACAAASRPQRPVARDLLAGVRGPVRDAVLLNAGAALGHGTGLGEPTGAAALTTAVRQGMDRAEAALDSGAAEHLLARWVEAPSGPHRLSGRVSLETEAERRLEVVRGVGAERDVGLVRPRRDLVEAVRDDVGQLLVVADPHHRDEVGVAGDRVDLGDSGELGDRRATSGMRSTSGVDEDDGGDHRASARRARVGSAHRRPCAQSQSCGDAAGAIWYQLHHLAGAHPGHDATYGAVQVVITASTAR